MGLVTAKAFARHSIGRLGLPEEIAVLWLCGPGSTFLLGHALAVDGADTLVHRRDPRDAGVVAKEARYRFVLDINEA